MHLALARHLVGPHDGNIVLGLAGDDASRAARAGVEIDHHLPVRRTHVALGPERSLGVVGRVDPGVLGSDLMHEGAAFHHCVGLHEGKGLARAGGLELGGEARDAPASTLVAREAADIGRGKAHAHDARVLAGQNAHRSREAPARRAKLDDVSVHPTALASELRADPGRRHPGHPRQRIGKLPQPGIVEVAGGAKHGRRRELDLESGPFLLHTLPQRFERRFEPKGLRGDGSERGGVETRAPDELGPVPTILVSRPQIVEVVRHPGSAPAQKVLERMSRVEQRPHRRLGQRDEAGTGLDVCPALERVMGGSDRAARGRRLRRAIAHCHAQRKLRECFHQGVALRQRGHQVDVERDDGERTPIEEIVAEDRQVSIEPATDAGVRGQVERSALVVEQVIHEGHRDLLDQIVGTAHDEAAPPGVEELGRQGADSRCPSFGRLRTRKRFENGRRLRRARVPSDKSEKIEGRLAPLRGGSPDPLVRSGSRERQATLDLDVPGRAAPAALGPGGGMGDGLRSGAEEVRPETDEELDVLEDERRRSRRSEQELVGFEQRRGGAAVEVVLDKAATMAIEETSDRSASRRAHDRTRDDTELSALAHRTGEPLGHEGIELGPAHRTSVEVGALQTSGVVERAQRRLTGCAEPTPRERVPPVALELDRTSIEHLDHEPAACGADGARARVEGWDARRDLLGRDQERNSLSHGDALAGGK